MLCKSIVVCNKYLLILFILCFVIVLTSCQPIFFPNTLAPAKPYSTGKGEAGIRSFNFAPLGGDFKIGITDNIQISCIAYPFHSTKDTDILSNYEGSVQINEDPSEKSSYLQALSVGVGVFMGPGSTEKLTYDVKTYGKSQTDYIYEGFYPGHKISNHVSVSFPLRMYEFIGHYQYLSASSIMTPPHTITTTTTSTVVGFQGAAFIPEMDWSFDWTYVAFRFGINTPIEFWESYNPITVVASPAFSAGLYGKW